MRLPAPFGSTSSFVGPFVGLFALGCAGASELSVGEGEAEPPSAQAVTSPVARTTPPAEANPPPGRGSAPEPAVPFDARWTDEVRAVVAAYEGWGRVDDEMRFAPWLCRMPFAATARWSESEHPDTHGHKLYTLYAMDPVAYGAQRSAMGEAAALPGLSQVIVKESFAPVPLDDEHHEGLGSGANGGMGEHRLRPAVRDGRRFVAGERKGLYIMMKADGATEGTDAGWIYATVQPDMITVTAVGVIDSCAGCHAEAGDDRLFGLPGPAKPPSPRSANANAVPR
jgi:hypothetical protein